MGKKRVGQKTNASWKAFERRIAERFGLRRRRADFWGRAETSTGRKGNNDACNPDGTPSDLWSLEMKLRTRIGWADVMEAVRQAERNRDHRAQLPLAVIKQTRAPGSDTLVCMRLDDFVEWFVGDALDGAADPLRVDPSGPPSLDDRDEARHAPVLASPAPTPTRARTSGGVEGEGHPGPHSSDGRGAGHPSR